MSGAWLHRFVPRPRARIRLFCFPYAGVGAAVYRSWAERLPAELEVCAVQLPGRGNRLREPAIDNMRALVEALLPALMPQLDLPFAFFGHSMGSVLAFEVAQRLVKVGDMFPVHLFVSGRRPPHVPGHDPTLHVLTDDQFVAEVGRRYGGIPAEVLNEPDLMALLLPCLRADIHALETHVPGPTVALPCPISAFGGANDPLTPREHLEAWRGLTRSDFRVRMFPGDHFYLDSQREAILADVAVTLSPIAIDTTSKGTIA